MVLIYNKNNQTGLKAFMNESFPGDSILPMNQSEFKLNLSKLEINGGASFRICMGEGKGIKDCIESQPEKKIYLFIFDADTLAAYDYSVIRDEKKYKDRIEIPYTMATNDANLIINYP
ncbi:MAG TPA: hypothetical protein PKX92_13940 [Edaphocola sp.]|nr:hypothetical protein [Edaphocola sp.]